MALTSRRREPLSDEEWEQRGLFAGAAMKQRCCAVCGQGGQFDAHHVVEKQYLKKNKLPLWDERNALRLCTRCHHQHTVRSKKVPLGALTQENIDYAVLLLGDYASDYLTRRYDGQDPRLEKAQADGARKQDRLN